MSQRSRLFCMSLVLLSLAPTAQSTGEPHWQHTALCRVYSHHRHMHRQIHAGFEWQRLWHKQYEAACGRLQRCEPVRPRRQGYARMQQHIFLLASARLVQVPGCSRRMQPQRQHQLQSVSDSHSRYLIPHYYTTPLLCSLSLFSSPLLSLHIVLLAVFFSSPTCVSLLFSRIFHRPT